MSSKISIIVPVFNVEIYVGNCIESLLAQTHKNIEIIMVDDGSTDNSGKICDEFAKIDGRIKVIHQRNAGVSAARNAGIEIATGDYIGFVDSDDYVLEEMYGYLLSICQKYEAAIAQCDRIYTEKVYSEREKIHKTSEKVVIIHKEKALHELLCSKSVRSSLWSKLYKKELFNNVRLDPRLVAGEDMIANYQLIAKADRIAVCDKVCYYYYKRYNSCTTGPINERIYNSIEIFQQYANCEENKKLKKSWKFNIAFRAINCIIRAIKQNELQKFQELRRYVMDARITLLSPHKFWVKNNKFVHMHIFLIWLFPRLYRKLILAKVR